MNERLTRVIGLPGAVLTGLGSILGTGAFVSIGLASGMWGDRILLAIPIAAVVAMFSGLSTAFLAGRYPVAGGAYEYGYETLNQWFGFSAGWLFLLAKTASAATAALGVGLYLGLDNRILPAAIVIVITLLVLAGVRRTTAANVILVGLSVLGIIWLAAVAPSRSPAWGANVQPLSTVLPATAFLFVAYTGFGRIATLGEEVRDPVRVIPRAVVVTLVVAAALYATIAWAGRLMGGAYWGIWLDLPTMDLPVVRVAAISAMLGVLLNLVLGLSRVWLAMGRRGDMPAGLARLNSARQPQNAVILAGLLVAAATLIGDIGLAWSFSAMTVLIYYAITNLAALAVDRTRLTSWLGLASCLVLSVFVPPQIWLVGAGLTLVGILWKTRTSRTV